MCNEGALGARGKACPSVAALNGSPVANYHSRRDRGRWVEDF